MDIKLARHVHHALSYLLYIIIKNQCKQVRMKSMETCNYQAIWKQVRINTDERLNMIIIKYDST